MRSVLVSLLLVITVSSSAQINIICPKLTDSTLNYFYRGADNQIIISGRGLPVNYSVTISGVENSIWQRDKNEYFVGIRDHEDTCTITITQNNRKIYSKQFNVRSIPDLVATLGGSYDTTIRKHRILVNPFLAVIYPNCYFKSDRRIISFTATFINGTDSIPTVGRGYLLSKEQLKLVKEAEPGIKIYFDDIRVACSSSRTTKAPPFWIKIE